MADNTETRDPLGELSNEEFDALKPHEKAARTRQYNDSLRDGDGADDDGGDVVNPQHTGGRTSEDADTVVARLERRAEAVRWITADASGEAV